MATANDRAILNAIINPILPVGEGINFEEIDVLDTEGKAALKPSTNHLLTHLVSIPIAICDQKMAMTVKKSKVPRHLKD